VTHVSREKEIDREAQDGCSQARGQEEDGRAQAGT
jgi:hypothetical protein